MDLGSCMLLCSGKSQGETGMSPSELSKYMELWLEESRKCDEDDRRKKFIGRRREDNTRSSGTGRRRNGDGWKKRARRSEEIMRH